MLRGTRSIQSWQENSKRRWSNFHLLEMQWSKIVLSSFQNFQIFFLNLTVKLYAQRIHWNLFNPLQFRNLIYLMKLWICTRSCSILQTTRWFLLSEVPWSIICKNLEEFCEERCKSKREKNGGKCEISDLKCFFFLKCSYDLAYIWSLYHT